MIIQYATENIRIQSICCCSTSIVSVCKNTGIAFFLNVVRIRRYCVLVISSILYWRCNQWCNLVTPSQFTHQTIYMYSTTIFHLTRIVVTTTYVPRVPQCLSPHPNWGLPLSQNQRGKGHTRLRVRGWGAPNSDERKSYTVILCLLCGRN